MLNEVKLIGNLGRDPEIRTMTNGGKVASLNVATSERWTDKNTGELQERTEWHRVSVFGDGLVGVVEKYLHKGSKVYLCGKLSTRKWTDQEGKDRWSTEVLLSGLRSHLILLDKREGDGERQPEPPPRDDLDDEIPF